MSTFEYYCHVEHKAALFLHRWSLPILRVAMAIVYIWFGLLKIGGISPVEGLVERTIDWSGVHGFVVFLGVWEVIIGFSLLNRSWQRVGLWLLFLQFPGTLIPLFATPEDCFTTVPYGLTLEGQYIVKNLVFAAAALVLLASMHKAPSKSAS